MNLSTLYLKHTIAHRKSVFIAGEAQDSDRRLLTDFGQILCAIKRVIQGRVKASKNILILLISAPETF